MGAPYETLGATTTPQVQTKDTGDYMRLDYGKPRVDLIPSIPLLELGKLCSYGAAKYSDHRWREGMPFSRVLGALFRHYLKYSAGERLDPETGLSHMTAVAWNALALVEYEHSHPEMDDRFVSIFQCILNREGGQCPEDCGVHGHR